MRPSVAIDVSDSSGPAAARRAVAAFCSDLMFDDASTGRAAIVVTEMATNLFKHAGTGEVVISAIAEGARVRLQVLGLDRGPGFDLARCLRDGYSTAGSPGNGLGAMQRLSDVFEVYSRQGAGAAVLSEIGGGTRATAPEWPFSIGAISVAKPGEEACGDAWAAENGASSLSVMLADGLGHGPGAEEAARAAVVAFRRSACQAPADCINVLHAALRPTRGAAVAVAQVPLASGSDLRFAGVGNATGLIAGEGAGRHLVSHSGTVGHEVRRVQEFVYPWARNARLVLTSDGIGTRWDLDAYPGILRKHPALLAGVLYRDFRRTRDDATVVVVAERPAFMEPA